MYLTLEQDISGAVGKANVRFDHINAIYDQFSIGGGQNPISHKIGLSQGQATEMDMKVF